LSIHPHRPSIPSIRTVHPYRPAHLPHRYHPHTVPQIDKECATLRIGLGAEDEASQDRLAELDLLQNYVKAMIDVVDKAVDRLTSPVERMKRLLSAGAGTQALIEEMAAENELDDALLRLLDQNVQAAKEAGQLEAAEYMEKVRKRATRWAVKTPEAAELQAQFAKDQARGRSGAGRGIRRPSRPSVLARPFIHPFDRPHHPHHPRHLFVP